jgi:hypothetical protein
MTIFDYIKDILVTKRGDLPMEQYVPYIVTRWLSFINPTIAVTVNQLNKQILLENKEMHYKTMISLFPKMKYAPRISYIKKVKEDKTEEDSRIKLLASKYELSEREIANLLSFHA